MIKINGSLISTPSDFSVSINDICKAERNANGEMVKELIATKRKLELSYSILEASKLSALFAVLNDNFFSVEYPDPQTGSIRTGTFYSGDRSVGMLFYKAGEPSWKDIRFSLIER